MLTKDQTEVVASSMLGNMKGTDDVTAGAATEIDQHHVPGIRVPRKIPSEEGKSHYNDWPNSQGVSPDS